MSAMGVHAARGCARAAPDERAKGGAMNPRCGIAIAAPAAAAAESAMKEKDPSILDSARKPPGIKRVQ
jgi:hypothetical protein